MGRNCLTQGSKLKESWSIHSDRYHLQIWGTSEIISDYRLHFKGETEKLLRQFNIQHHKSSPYHPQTNGVVKAANKKIGRILKKSMKN